MATSSVRIALRSRLATTTPPFSAVVVVVVGIVTSGLVLFPVGTSAAFPDAASFGSTGEQLSADVIEFLYATAGIDRLQKGYTDLIEKADPEVENLDGAELVQTVAQKLGDIFRRKVEALQKSTEFAERLISRYAWKNNLKEGDCNPIFSKDVNDSYENFHDSDEYKHFVNLVNSSVHVPIDIYKGDIEILNALTWTSDLDQIWKTNKADDPSLTWQYFGSQTGVLRMFPGAKWKYGNDEVDLYDVRRRPWYTQGASSPKEMLILIDTSGSCHGQALALMKHSINSIIDTLGENDFVNVANFASEVDWVGCFKTFIQATPRNKQKLVASVNNLTAKDVANYSRGFEFAFQQFIQYNSSNRTNGDGASCNQVIMFLTDGGTDRIEEVFKKYNPQKKIRVFSFAVGPIANPISAVKFIGCVNRGNFYQIPAMGAIRSKVQEYIGILSNGISPDTYIPLLWSYSYDDYAGLGLVTSVTMPVFNRTLDVGNETLAGVMGIDVPIAELVKAIPVQKLKPNGYAFIINPNGNIVYHPNLKIDSATSATPSIDFVEIEEETETKLEIRTKMIDLETGETEVEDYVIGLDDHHASVKSRTYYYTAIPHSNFSLAIVLPENAKHYVHRKVKAPGDPLNDEDIMKLGNSKSHVIIKFNEYCGNIEHVSNVSTPLEDFIETLKTNYSNCNDIKVQELMFDVLGSSDIEEHWIHQDALRKRDGIIATFVAGLSNFTRIYLLNDTSTFEEQMDSLRDIIFKRIWDTDGWLFSYMNVQVALNDTGPVVMAMKGITATLKSEDVQTVAVAGILLPQDRLYTLVIQAEPKCAQSHFNCYLLDDGGFIIFDEGSDLSNRSVGRFFGQIEPHLMDFFVNRSIYIPRQVYDYQGRCSPDSNKQTSSGMRIFPSLLYELLSFNWWTATSTWTYLNVLNIYNWLFTDKLALADELQSFGMDVATSDCIRLLYQYNFNAKLTSSTGSIYCADDCSRLYAVTRLKDTNLLLVMAGLNKCESSCDNQFTPPPFQPVKTEDPQFFTVNEGPCNVTPRYRRRPPCYEENPFESESHCSGCVPSASLRLLSGAVLAAILLTSLRRSCL